MNSADSQTQSFSYLCPSVSICVHPWLTLFPSVPPCLRNVTGASGACTARVRRAGRRIGRWCHPPGYDEATRGLSIRSTGRDRIPAMSRRRFSFFAIAWLLAAVLLLAVTVGSCWWAASVYYGWIEDENISISLQNGSMWWIRRSGARDDAGSRPALVSRSAKRTRLLASASSGGSGAGISPFRFGLAA